MFSAAINPLLIDPVSFFGRICHSIYSIISMASRLICNIWKKWIGYYSFPCATLIASHYHPTLLRPGCGPKAREPFALLMVFSRLFLQPGFFGRRDNYLGFRLPFSGITYSHRGCGLGFGCALKGRCECKNLVRFWWVCGKIALIF